MTNLFKLEQVCGQFSVDFSIDLSLAPLAHSVPAPSAAQTDAFEDVETPLEQFTCQLLPTVGVLRGRCQRVETMLESQDLEGHVAGGQDEHAHSAQRSTQRAQ